MKIGIDARLWNETGVGRYVRNLVQELAHLDTKNDYVLFVLPKDVNKIQSLDFLSHKKKWKLVAADSKWHSIKEQFYFLSVINKEQLDLMHFTYFSVPIFYTKPFIVTIHDLIPYHFPTGKASTLPEPLYEFKQQGYRLVIHTAASRAQKIIVPLNTTKEDVVKTLNISASRVEVTPEGVDMSLLTNTKPTKMIDEFVSRYKYFLYVGNAYPHKNIERLINSFIQLKEEYETVNLRLVIIGKDDAFISRVKKQVKKEEDIVFFHEISDGDLSYLYHHAIALIAPSLLEGFGLTPLEAIANDCPVILSDIPAFNEVYGHVGFYFDPYDEKALLKKMIEVYNLDPIKRKEKIIAGKKQLKEYSWKEMAKKTLEIYESSTGLRQG